MKKTMLFSVVLGVGFASGIAAAQVRDWRDLEETRKHIAESIHELERARAANHYDMQGHGVKAEAALRDAEHELHLAVEAAKASR